MRKLYLGRKMQNQMVFLKQKFLKPKSILKIILTPILSIVIIFTLVYFSIVYSYSNRILVEDENIPEEISNAIVVFRSSELESEEKFGLRMIEKAVSLYDVRRVKKIYVMIINDAEIDDTIVKEKLKKIPEDKYQIVNTEDSPSTICNQIKIGLQIQKALILTYYDYLIRLGYLCNSDGIFYVGFSIFEEDFFKINPRVSDVAQDVIEIISK